MPVSINVSSKHLLKRGFVEHVQQTLAHYNIDPSFIEFEVTESSIIQYEEHVKSHGRIKENWRNVCFR